MNRTTIYGPEVGALCVRRYELAQGERVAPAAHAHAHVVAVLAGVLELATLAEPWHHAAGVAFEQGPWEHRRIQPGQSVTIGPRQPHSVGATELRSVVFLCVSVLPMQPSGPMDAHDAIGNPVRMDGEAIREWGRTCADGRTSGPPVQQ